MFGYSVPEKTENLKLSVMTLRTFLLALHYLFELESYGKFFCGIRKEKDFGNKLAQAIGGKFNLLFGVFEEHVFAEQDYYLKAFNVLEKMKAEIPCLLFGWMRFA